MGSTVAKPLTRIWEYSLEFNQENPPSEEDEWIRALSQIEIEEPINTSLELGGRTGSRVDARLFPFFNSSWEDEDPTQNDSQSDVRDFSEEERTSYTSAEIAALVRASLKFREDPVGYETLSKIAFQDEGWLDVMQALVNGISIEDETGLDTIVTFVMDDMHNPPHSVIKAIPLHLFTPRPEDDTIDGYILNAETISSDCEALPSGLHQNSIAQNLKSSVSSMAKSETPKQVDDTTKRRNTCLILGCLADKLIGPRSDLLFQGTVQEFLLAQLADEDTHPAIILHALIALEKFAKTNVNKTKIMGALDADPNLLTKFECWKNSDNSLQAQVAFCAEWALDNVLVTSNREFGCQQVDPSNNYVILNTDNATEYIKISPDGLESRCDSEYFESVRSTGCAGFSGMDSGVWYYEVELVTDGIMQIGWATRDASLLNQDQDGVGDDGQSIGYDGFRRIIWQNGRRQTLEETPKWKPGDVVGTILDFNEPVVQFYLNGIRVATNNTVFETARGGFNAAASFCNLQQCKFNFGSKPFKFSHLTPHMFECFNDYAAKLGNNCRLVLPKQVSRVDLRTLSVNENENACILCFDNTANTRLSPCLHDHFCSMCLDRLDDKWTCPLCRQDIIEKVLMIGN